jgi:hypothetical protein
MKVRVLRPSIVLMSILPAIFLLGCTGERERQDKVVAEMQFEVDQSLLGSRIATDIYGIQFHPPVDWDQVSPDVFTEAYRRLVPDEKVQHAFEIKPEYIFLNRHNGSSLIVSHVGITDPEMDRGHVLQEFTNTLADRPEGSAARQTDFMKDGIHMHQFLIQSDEIVNFKFLMFTKTDALFQLDYVVPRNVYPAEIKAIESSIGSIQYL